MATNNPLALILEDEPFIALDIEASLAAGGFEVISLRTGGEARDWLAQQLPSVAVLDIMLADGSPDGVAETLLQRGIPFIIYSGQLETVYAETPFAKGHWLGKPSSPETLVETAWSLIGAA